MSENSQITNEQLFIKLDNSVPESLKFLESFTKNTKDDPIVSIIHTTVSSTD